MLTEDQATRLELLESGFQNTIKSLGTFDKSPPATDFERGFKAALVMVLDECFGRAGEPPIDPSKLPPMPPERDDEW